MSRDLEKRANFLSSKTKGTNNGRNKENENRELERKWITKERSERERKRKQR
jgi:hypothetical protein